MSAALFFACLLTLGGAEAVPPLGRPGRCKSSVKPLPKKAHDLRARGAPAPAIAKLVGSTGVRRIAVILVDFPSAGGSTSGRPAYANDAEGNDWLELSTAIAKFRAYMSEVSYGQLTVRVTFFYQSGGQLKAHDSAAGPLTSTFTPISGGGIQPMETYGADTEASLTALAKDATDRANALSLNVSTEVRSSRFDGVMIAHAGFGEETSGKSGDITAAYVRGGDHGGGFGESVNFPVQETGSTQIFGVICHEFHHLLGAPDLYNTAGGYAQIGSWELMDLGPWNGGPAGSDPSSPGPWVKALVGWITPTKITGRQSISIRAAQETSTDGFYRLDAQSAADPNTEYFLLEYRRKNHTMTWDKAQPSGGLLVWHIDDSVGDINLNNVNQDDSHRRVDLHEAAANFVSHSQTGENRSQATKSVIAQSSDPFGEASGLREFNIPKSDAYNGAVTGITVSNIAGNGSGQMTADVFVARFDQTAQANWAIPYPNPWRPSSGSEARLSFQLNKPSADIRLELYTLSGELVRSFTSSERFTRRVEDNLVTYEYPWNGKNFDGEDVASGVYLYRVKAKYTDGRTVTRVGKIAVIR